MSAFSEQLLDATTLSDDVTSTGGTRKSRNLNLVTDVSMQVVNDAANPVTFTIEGSLDGINWVTYAYGEGSSAAYTQAAKTVSAGAAATLFFPSDDYVKYLRVNVSAANANGTHFTLYGR